MTLGFSKHEDQEVVRVMKRGKDEAVPCPTCGNPSLYYSLGWDNGSGKTGGLIEIMHCLDCDYAARRNVYLSVRKS